MRWSGVRIPPVAVKTTMPMPKKPRAKCRRCGKECARPKGIYCTSACQRAFEWEQRKNAALKCGRFVTWKNAKRYLLETHGTTCLVCGLTEWNGQPMPVTIDHINGDYSDHSIINVRLICPNCDAQTDTYKGRNMGNGRHSRRERYQKGLSY